VERILNCCRSVKAALAASSRMLRKKDCHIFEGNVTIMVKGRYYDMKKTIAVIISTILIVNSLFTVAYGNPLSVLEFDGCSYYNEDYKLGVVGLDEESYSGAELIVEEVTSGETYEKVQSYFEGDIKMYDIRLKKDGVFLGVENGSFVAVAFNDGGISSIFNTAEIYHIDEDERIIDLHAARAFEFSYNFGRISSFGLFVVTDSPIKDESVLFVPTPTPTAYYTPGPTVRPYTTLRPISLGDVNIDDVVDANDALCILKHAARVSVLSEGIVAYGDMNDDKVVDVLDALFILKKAAKIE